MLISSIILLFLSLSLILSILHSLILCQNKQRLAEISHLSSYSHI